MKKLFSFKIVFNCTYFLLLILIFGSCKKSEKDTEAHKSQLDSVSQQNIIEIATTREKFNEWVDTVFKYKLGTPVNARPDFTIRKVSLTQIDSFKLAEILISVDQSSFNFFIGTIFEFTQVPKHKQFVLKPVIKFPTPTRTLIFSSGNNGITNMSYSKDSIYTFMTDQKNLFFLGAM